MKRRSIFKYLLAIPLFGVPKAKAKPRRLHEAVFENGTYWTGGEGHFYMKDLVCFSSPDSHVTQETVWRGDTQVLETVVHFNRID